MTTLVIQKAIALLLLIVVGYLLQKKFQEPSSVGAIRTLILNAALPATIFLSTIEINTQLSLLLLPGFALAVNVFLMAIGVLLAYLLIDRSQKSKARALILLFPSLAPGLTVYPFIEQFLGRQSLAWAALADMGNKTFVLIGLYALALYWYRKSCATASLQTRKQWKTIGLFLLNEPVNLAILFGVALAMVGITTAHLPVFLSDALQKLALCATPLILFYVGISLNLKSLQFGKILLVLLARAGAGFLFSAGAIALLHPASPEIVRLFVALPQASCSLWPLLHGIRINAQADTEQSGMFFDADFATSLLALSFPFSIVMMLVVFSSAGFFDQPSHLTGLGLVLLIALGVLLRYQSLPIRLQTPIALQVRLQSPVVTRAAQSLSATAAIAPSQMPEVEPITKFTDEQNRNLKELYLLIQQALHQSIGKANSSLQVKFLLQDRVLLVLCQHEANHALQRAYFFEQLTQTLHQLNLPFIDKIQFFFRVVGQKQAYASYSLLLTAARFHLQSQPLPPSIAAQR